MVAKGKLTANAGPMPAALAIVDQTHHVQQDATKTISSEHKLHRTSFPLSPKRSGSSAHGAYQWFSSCVPLGMNNAKRGYSFGEHVETTFNQRIAMVWPDTQKKLTGVSRPKTRRSFDSESNW